MAFPILIILAAIAAAIVLARQSADLAALDSVIRQLEADSAGRFAQEGV